MDLKGLRIECNSMDWILMVSRTKEIRISQEACVLTCMCMHACRCVCVCACVHMRIDVCMLVMAVSQTGVFVLLFKMW